MKLELDVQKVSVSNTELLKLLEYVLRLDYDRDHVRNGIVGHYYFTDSGEMQWEETPIPERVYKAYTILRNYLTEGD